MELFNTFYTCFIAIIMAIVIKKQAKKQATQLNEQKEFLINKFAPLNLPVKLFTYEIDEVANIVKADDNGMVIPVKLCDDYPLQIPIYTSEGESHQIPMLVYDKKFWRVETYVQLETHVNIFVLPMGKFNPNAPIAAN